MEFTVFTDAALAPCFVLDSEVVSASWVHEELRLELTVIDDPAKVMTRGQRILFTDPRGDMQLFEVRKVDHTEPDAAQIVTAEHIALAELSDDHIAPKEFTNTSASAALSSVLDGTLWSVGTVTVTGTSSVDTAMGNVWEACNAIAEAWNGRIVPRITFDASGVTGRYIDLLAAGGTWRGITLEITKNLVDVGVTIDDTDLYTALYGYGRATDGNPLTFAGVTWTTAGGNPANKPAGQTYVEDATATAAFGRNGRPRFGYYQNGDITDPSILLQKTWETLQAVKTLRISIESTVADLRRLGYADQPLRLYDIAKVIYSERGNVVEQQGEIIRMQEDLLDPTATQLTIGTYIPNIIYIQRENARKTYGRGGGGGHGQTPQEATFQEFYTQISANEYQIDLVARQVTQVETDVGVTEEILRQAGLSINAEGVLVYADDNVNMWQSKLNVQANRITSEVSRATEAEGSLSSRITQTAEAIESKVSAGDIASTINQTAQSVLIEASKINLVGYVTASELSATNATISNLVNGVTQANHIWAGTITGSSVSVSGSLTLDSGATLSVDGYSVTARAISMSNVIASGTVRVFGTTTTEIDLTHHHAITAEEGTGANAGKIVLTLGTTVATSSTDNVATFSIAATQAYRDGVAAATTAGYNSGWAGAWGLTGLSAAQSSSNQMTVYLPPQTPIASPSAADRLALTLTVEQNGVDASGNPRVDITIGGTTYARTVVTAGSSTGYDDGWAAARSRVSYPTTASSSSNFAFSFPPATVDGSAATQNYYLTADSSPSNGTAYAYVHAGSTSGTVVARVSTYALYTGGWDAAAAKVVYPTQPATGTSIQIRVPQAGNYTGYQTLQYDMSQDASWTSNKKYVYVKGHTITNTFARVQVDASGIYNNGWAAARAKLSIPTSASTSNNISVGYPPATVDGAQANQSYWLTADSSPTNGAAYAYLHAGSTGGTVVARVSTYGLYTAGYTAAQNDLSVTVADTGSGATSAGQSNYAVGLGRTWKYLYITATIGSKTVKYVRTIRIDASSVTPG